MKLSMWMIANRLTSLEPEIDIVDDAPAVLKSARMAYATNCVTLTQSDNNVICSGEGGTIKINDMNIKEAFEILQSVFDFYNDWNTTVKEAANSLDFKTAINESWHIFHNPINLLDANNKVISLSEQYGENDINDEWNHLCNYGYSSIQFVRYMKTLYNMMDFYKRDGAGYFKFDKSKTAYNVISSAIYYNSNYCGRMSVIEKERPINSGDLQMLNYLVSLFAPSMGILHSQSIKNSYKNVFRSLIIDEHVNYEELTWQLDYMKWTVNDVFKVSIITMDWKIISHDVLSLVSNIIRNQIPQTSVFILDEAVVVIYNLRTVSTDDIERILKQTIKKNKLCIGVSLPCSSINKLKYFYKQALSAINYGKIYNPKQTNFQFYDCAIDYLIETGSFEDALNACHPDVIHLWKYDSAKNSEKLDTLWAYIENDLSLSATAQALFVHRNTLIYRIKKLNEIIHFDVNDIYTRDYMKLSMRIIKLYLKKYKKTE